MPKLEEKSGLDKIIHYNKLVSFTFSGIIILVYFLFIIILAFFPEILKKNPKASFLFYDKELKIQVRLKVEAIINHNNDVTKQSWEKTQHISRKCYLVDNGPGTESDIPTSGLKPELDNFDYTKEQSEEGYRNFTVIQCKVKLIEWLYLAAKGHRRARFNLENNKNTWLIP